MPKEASNNQNQTFTEQDARIVINRSPGGQLLGLLVVIIGIVGVIKHTKSN